MPRVVCWGLQAPKMSPGTLGRIVLERLGLWSRTRLFFPNHRLRGSVLRLRR